MSRSEVRMKLKLEFEIECGRETCASEPGKFCRFFRGNIFGNDNCFFFGRVYDNQSGWIQRHPECIKLAERISE
jgi:hypothetical protein